MPGTKHQQDDAGLPPRKSARVAANRAQAEEGRLRNQNPLSAPSMPEFDPEPLGQALAWVAEYDVLTTFANALPLSKKAASRASAIESAARDIKRAIETIERKGMMLSFQVRDFEDQLLEHEHWYAAGDVFGALFYNNAHTRNVPLRQHSYELE